MHSKVPSCRGAIRVCSSLSEVCSAQGDFSKALEFVDDGLARGYVTLPADHWLLGRLTSLRGVYLLRFKKYGESEAALLCANTIFSITFSTTDELTVETARSIVELYTDWQRPEAAALWEKALPEAAHLRPSKPIRAKLAQIIKSSPSTVRRC